MFQVPKIVRLAGMFLACMWLKLPTYAQSTDTLQISLPQLEQQFLDRNFQLLAQRYQISAAEANVIQARLRPNPNVSFQSNFYNPQTGKFFQYGQNSAVDLANSQFNKGGMTIQLQQLIQLAGKRSKLVGLAESNRTLTTIAFRDILRTLRYQLYTTYANLYYDLQALRLLQEEESRQGRLIQSSQIALKAGGIAPYEVTRLEVALRDLRANIANYRAQIADEQATLRLLIRQDTNAFIFPSSIPSATPAPPSLATAIDSALTNRPDAALSQEQINNAQRSLALERARRTPDLTAGFIYDKYGNAFNNFTGLSVAMDIPVFNRNQGAVKVAEIGVKSAQAGFDNAQAIVRNDVIDAYDKLTIYYQQQNTLPADYLSRVQNISVEATQTYNARVIGLLDYLDKIRTYQSALLNYITLQNNIFQAQQQVNYTTNTRFF
ncbi:TolC family protein [Spirosoma terrae]|uniref:TolC family protein n=2 Tax=Spirosoma terrae TaxID=1968276 RepID=A0A6L9LFU3_9BACT|nr:TolC family protein [Spirosoma terrae]